MKSESSSVGSNSLQPHGRYSSWNSPGQNTGVGSQSLLQGIFPIQGLNPGLPNCWRILYQLSHQGSPRILEWVAYSFSTGFFLTQESNWGLLHCRRILYQLSYQGSPYFDKSCTLGGFPGRPVVKTWPSYAGGACLIPGCGTKIPHAS